jgi:hypothetical protein
MLRARGITYRMPNQPVWIRNAKLGSQQFGRNGPRD